MRKKWRTCLSRISKYLILLDVKRKTFLWTIDFTISIWDFDFLTKSVLNRKELLNFQTPDPRTKVSLLTKEQKTRERSDDRAFRIPVLFTDSCKLLETKIYSSLRCMIQLRCFAGKWIFFYRDYIIIVKSLFNIMIVKYYTD